jgi:hypothetical protein
MGKKKKQMKDEIEMLMVNTYSFDNKKREPWLLPPVFSASLAGVCLILQLKLSNVRFPLLRNLKTLICPMGRTVHFMSEFLGFSLCELGCS